MYDHIPKESMKVFNDSLIERQGFPPISGDPIPRYVDWLFGVVILIFVLTAGALTSPLYFLPEALDDNWNNLIENIIGEARPLHKKSPQKKSFFITRHTIRGIKTVALTCRDHSQLWNWEAKHA